MNTREALTGLSVIPCRWLKTAFLPRQNGKWLASARVCLAFCGRAFDFCCDAEGRETLRHILERLVAPIGARRRHDLRLELVYLYRMYGPDTPLVFMRPLTDRQRQGTYAVDISDKDRTPDACTIVFAPISQLHAAIEEKLKEGWKVQGPPFRTGAKIVLEGEEIPQMAQAMVRPKRSFCCLLVGRRKANKKES